MSSALSNIANHLTSRTEFSPHWIELARDAVIDTLGCMIAGARDASVQAVTTAFAAEMNGNGTHWLVTGGRTVSSISALVNGTAAHALDFDDNFHPARAHASAVLVPALLAAISRDHPVTGRQFLEAYMTGLEAQSAVGSGVNPSHYNKGWHGTATVGAIGAAAGVARLLGANTEQTGQSMSLATSMACGPKAQFGTLVKPIHAGIAARNAVEAARLAMAGATGAIDVLEKPQGFLDLFGGDEPVGWADNKPNGRHIIETRGLVTKRHPCCASTHRAIDMLLDLKAEYGLREEDIATIDAKVGISAVKNLPYPKPSDEMQARFSMQYCLATAFRRGALSLADFTMSALSDGKKSLLMDKINMHSFTADEERGHERLPHELTVTLTNGEILRRSRLHAKGAREDALGEDQRKAKFIDCLEWAGRPANSVYEQLLSMPRAGSMLSLLAGIWSKEDDVETG
ncbi:MmgE/PrpD family protein [Aliirhizobium smilacinae]|uniref:MmgE/PrpD family protein n=1 Tax=Aliirhizobium smilacinae TaxID=1395944 RepID=A0A5C4XIY9_9HYPH|nr:MmgE/PrpD family protein [Rhizobium smilacinae]TNM63475.1 MmgE/PrpD family protein [Rhizobium smilacinae]